VNLVRRFVNLGGTLANPRKAVNYVQ